MPSCRLPAALLITLGTLAALALPGTAAAVPASTDAPASVSARGWISPVPGAAILRAFEPPEHRWSPGHRGVDLAAAPGTALVAPADGVVTLARRVAGVSVIVLAHGSVRSDRELRSTFEAATTALAVGALVRRGEVVGTVEEWPGHCVGPACVHWGVRRGPDYVDPLALLRGPVRLLPVGPPVRRSTASVTSALTEPDPAQSRTESRPATDDAADPTAAPARAAPAGHGDRGPVVPAGVAVVGALTVALAISRRPA